ncbi:MAG TPA: hypothetical protein VLE03_04650 [Nitrospiraceae bacterium]|nr:hypothetical protein [Nitrospiraceae bacterium]
MQELAQAPRFEPRWPVALTIVAVNLLLALLPGRLRLFPIWATYVVGVAVLAPIAAVGLTAARIRWLRVEHTVTLLFFVVATVGNLTSMGNLIGAMLNRSAETSGLQLLTSSIAIWGNNVLMFSLLYWQIDRGGPEARVNNEGTRPDWLFPQEGAPAEDVPPGWRPTFIDYLFLGYSTATAFSTTDVMPLTSRAKMLMMLESAISLATIVVVAARAINILGS